MTPRGFRRARLESWQCLALLLSALPAQAVDAPSAPATPTARTDGGKPEEANRPFPGEPDTGMRNLQGEDSRGDTKGGIQPGWPSPVNDQQLHLFLLFDNLEFQAGGSPSALRYDFLGWYGGDYNRLWVKSEGRQNVAVTSEGGVELQALYGRLLHPYFDLQAGLRLDYLYGEGPGRARVHAVLALEGLVAYRFDVEPALFVDQSGNVSARFTGTYELLLTQRLILQPRIEINFALQSVPRFEIGSGLSDLEAGLRLRYELRREFAPYVGFSYSQSFFGTADFARRAGEAARSGSAVAGVRMWY